MSRRVRKPRTVYELKPRTIYGLVDPRDELVHYVGMSIKVFKRFKEHVEDMVFNLDLRKWIEELRSLGIKPKLRIFSSCPTLADGFNRERYWIYRMFADGHPLKNSRTTINNAIDTHCPTWAKE